jgi:hypothetical protein
MRNVSLGKSSKALCKKIPNWFRVKNPRKGKCSIEQQSYTCLKPKGHQTLLYF